MIFIDPKLWAAASGKHLGDYAAGDIVQLRENGSPEDYLVVHQGLPASIYDESCDGTWLLRKNIAENRAWDSSDVNDYDNSEIDAYLNGDWITRYDSKVQSAINQVKIPYRAGSGYGKTVTSGANGMSTKIFLLSATEVSFNMSYMPTNEGAELSYFAGCADDGDDSKRIAKHDGANANWWLRSPCCNSNGGSWCALFVFREGNWGYLECSYSSYGIRPALILPFNTLVDKNNLIA